MDYKLVCINNKSLLDGEVEVYNTIKTFNNIKQFLQFFYNVKVVVNTIERKLGDKE